MNNVSRNIEQDSVAASSRAMFTGMQTIIAIDQLSKTYDSGLRALNNINLEIRRGEIFALLGPNGAGKTTLLRTISGMISPDEGRIAMAGEDITALGMARRVRAGIGLVPLFLWPDANHVLLAVTALGVGQALSIAPQLALVTKICAREIQTIGSAPVLGRYRLLERVGSAMGPFIASALDICLGGADAITVLGLFGVISAVIFSLAFLVLGAERPTEEAAT